MAFEGFMTWQPPKARDGAEKLPRWQCGKCQGTKENLGYRFACRQCDWRVFGTKPALASPEPVQKPARRSGQVVELSELMQPYPDARRYRPGSRSSLFA